MYHSVEAGTYRSKESPPRDLAPPASAMAGWFGRTATKKTAPYTIVHTHRGSDAGCTHRRKRLTTPMKNPWDNAEYLIERALEGARPTEPRP